MRELTLSEIGLVSGAGESCPAEGQSGNEIEGIKNFEKLGDDLVAFYEGLVQAASHIIERVADAL